MDMERLGRPPLTEAVIKQRIADYCSRYGASLSDGGFPVYPAGQRETPQHYEWIALFKVVSRFRERAGRVTGEGVWSRCPICFKPGPKTGGPHRRCATVVEFVRGLGVAGLER